MEDTIVCTISMRNGDSYSLEFHKDEYWDADVDVNSPLDGKLRKINVRNIYSARIHVEIT